MSGPLPEPDQEHGGQLWRRLASTGGPDYARGYAARFDALAASGQDVHGEASFLAGLVPRGGSVLDAGCGTGRVGARLHELGYRVTGVDVDETMVEVARERTPAVTWHVADLAALDLPQRFDAVVAAGNVVPLLGTRDLTPGVTRLARHLRPGGLLVAGFGIASSDLPPGVPVLALSAYDDACLHAGLRPEDRHAGWDGSPYAGGGYVVTVHRTPSGPHPGDADSP